MPIWNFKATSNGLGANTTILAEAFSLLPLRNDSDTSLVYSRKLSVVPGPPAQFVLTLNGRGFDTRTAGGETTVTDGTINKLVLKIAGQTHVTATGFRLSAETFDDLAIPGMNNVLALERFLFRGNDVINGTAIGDILNGQRGSDTLNGKGGGDQFDGGAGNDRLNGGAGNDTMAGGAGVDRFVFAAKGGVDTITDFTGADIIALDNDVFTGIGNAGALAPSRFKSTSGNPDANDRIFYDQATGDIFYDRDGSGSATAVLFARITAGTNLTAADFLILS